MRRGKWFYWCTSCRRWMWEKPNAPKCRECGQPYRLPSPTDPRQNKPKREAMTYFEQVVTGIERDLMRNGELDPHDATMPVDDDLPF